MIITKTIEKIEAAKVKAMSNTSSIFLKKIIEEQAEELKAQYKKILIVTNLN